MSLKKFYGANSREAMTEARRALGEDAVVISTRKTDRGVEVVAASQSALASLTDREPVVEAPVVSAAPTPKARRPFNERVDVQRTRTLGIDATAPHDEPNTDAVVPFLQFVQEPQRAAAPKVFRNPRTAARKPAEPVAPAAPVAPVASVAPRVDAPVPTFAQATTPVADPPVMLGDAPNVAVDQVMNSMRSEMHKEFSQIREWMMGQFDTISFQEAARRRPQAAAVQKDLLQAGFSPRLARDVSKKLPEGLDEHQARAWAAAVLEKNLVCARSESDLVDGGGIFALVGPTGVGKTTTVAKLASRCAVKYGRESVGLITIDSYRIGAQDQLRIYGKILGISVHTAQDRETLLAVLRSLAGKRLILIDTVGLGQRDERVQELLSTVGNHPIKRVLVMNAAAQGETLEDVVVGYRGAQNNVFAGAVLSKTDEAVRLGGALDVLIRNRLPLLYETNGQRVPEDITIASAKSLILRAVTHLPARAYQVPDDEVGMTFFSGAIAGGAGAAHA